MDKEYYKTLIYIIDRDIDELKKLRRKVDYHDDIYEAYVREDGHVVKESKVLVLTRQIDEAYEMRNKLDKYISKKGPSPKYTNKLTPGQKKELETGVKQPIRNHVKVQMPGTVKADGSRSRSFLISIPAKITKDRVSEYKLTRKRLDTFIQNYISPQLKNAGFGEFGWRYYLPSKKGNCVLRVKITVKSTEAKLEQFCDKHNYIYWPFTSFDRDEAIIHVDEFPEEGIVLNVNHITL